MRGIHMALLDKERFRMFAMRRSMGILQNRKALKAILKAFEHKNKTKAKIDDTVNKMARTFNLVVKNEIVETNHSIRALEDNVRELSETVEDLQKQINEAALKKKKADHRTGGRRVFPPAGISPNTGNQVTKDPRRT